MRNSAANLPALGRVLVHANAIKVDNANFETRTSATSNVFHAQLRGQFRGPKPLRILARTAEGNCCVD